MLALTVAVARQPVTCLACETFVHLNCQVIIKTFHCLHYNFETSNGCYTKTTCLIDFKLTRSIVWVNRSLYTNFQVILNFHENIEIFNFKGHRHLLWSCKHVYKAERIVKLAYLVKK